MARRVGTGGYGGIAGAARARPARLAVGLGALAGAAALLGRVAPREWPQGTADVPRWVATAPPEAPVLALATLAAYGCLAWLAFVLLAVAAKTRVALPGRAFAERVLGVAAVTATAGVLAAAPAAAEPGPGPFDRLAAPAPRPAASRVVVAPGDTLWGIASRHLGDGAAPAAVAAEWPRWYAANRDTIGSDPGLILPGQRLVPPGATR